MRYDTNAPSGTVAAGRAIRRVLIVDDSRAHRLLIAKVLRRWGYEFLEASSGQEALELLTANEIDLVLSDWVMPQMSGLELCQAFRDLDRAHYVYFILLTSKSAREDVAMGLAAGADDFLSKPINSEELMARISAGERLVAMQRILEEKNSELAHTLGELQTLYDAVARDLVEARRLQQSLVPQRAMRFEGADVALLLRPSGHVGGDLVGAFAVDDQRICVYAIDVSGHGIASALMTARLAGYLSAASPENNVALTEGPDGSLTLLPLGEVCGRLNASILADIETELYFTMAIAACDLATGAVALAQAGHPHPMVQRADGSTHFVGEGGMPIGLFEEAEFTETRFILNAGDRLLLHSDGFTEATADGTTMLDQDGLARLVGELSELSGEAFLETLVWKLSDFTGDADFEDDVSGVLLEFGGRAPRGS
ncbi:MAG: fused response regulator/phosphatase [Pseudomonadota bacterium]